MGAMQRYITYALIDHKRTSDLDSDFNDNNLFRNNGAYQKVTVSSVTPVYYEQLGRSIEIIGFSVNRRDFFFAQD